MTFDARRTTPAPDAGNLKFAIITLSIVVGAFLAVLYVPMPFSGSTSAPPVRVAPDAPASSYTRNVFKRDKAAQAYFTALSRIDPDAGEEARLILSRAGDEAVHEQAQRVFEHGAGVLKTHAEDLARAPTSHLDGLLDLTRKRLRTAARNNDKWCRGARYVSMASMEFSNPAEFERQFDALKPALQDYSFEVMTRLLLAAEDGRKNPVMRGPLSSRDEMALQGVMVSLMADPEIMPLIMSAQGGDDPEAMLRKMNVCLVAATAVSAVKTLPQDTKGRLMAEMAHGLENGPGGFSTIGGFPGF